MTYFHYTILDRYVYTSYISLFERSNKSFQIKVYVHVSVAGFLERFTCQTPSLSYFTIAPQCFTIESPLASYVCWQCLCVPLTPPIGYYLVLNWIFIFERNGRGVVHKVSHDYSVTNLKQMYAATVVSYSLWLGIFSCIHLKHTTLYPFIYMIWKL